MSLWGQIFAAGYDRFMADTERAGLGAMRAELLSQATGRVLELGAGTGVNLPHYGASVSELTLTEPEQPMARRLERAVRARGVDARIVRTPAEQLPFAADSFDTVVSTLVLCTVSDPERVLAEVARVLVPGGRLLFLEHVRAQDARLARWQDRLHPLWLRCGHGCNCNRPTPALIAASPLKIEHSRQGALPKAPPIVRPLVSGVAVAPA
jgi:ubiquinone/menaquinone biosynthesis C-methylase UbiE